MPSEIPRYGTNKNGGQIMSDETPRVSREKKLTTAAGAPVVDNQNVTTVGPRGPMTLQNIWFMEKLGHFDREVIPERRMHAKRSGAYGTFTVTGDITRFTRAKVFSRVGKKTDAFARFSTVAGERERLQVPSF
jgi:catalase